jgi:hypothetical protein
MSNKNDVEVPLEDILDWFHTNYEDAVHGVFHNGRDEGYQFLPGAGPCDPLDELQAEFPDADPEVLQEAADILLPEANAWVKKGVYPAV